MPVFVRPTEPSNGTGTTRATIELTFDLPTGLQYPAPVTFSFGTANDAHTGVAATNTAITNVSLKISISPFSADPMASNVGHTQNLVSPQVGGEDTSVKPLFNAGAAGGATTDGMRYYVYGREEREPCYLGSASFNETSSIAANTTKSDGNQAKGSEVNGNFNKEPFAITIGTSNASGISQGNGNTNVAASIHENTNAATPIFTFGGETVNSGAANIVPVGNRPVNTFLLDEKTQVETSSTKSTGNTCEFDDLTTGQLIDSLLSERFIRLNTNSEQLAPSPSLYHVADSKERKNFFSGKTFNFDCSSQSKSPGKQAVSGYTSTLGGVDSSSSICDGNTSLVSVVPATSSNVDDDSKEKDLICGESFNCGCSPKLKRTASQAASGFAATPAAKNSSLLVPASLFGNPNGFANPDFPFSPINGSSNNGNTTFDNKEKQPITFGSHDQTQNPSVPAAKQLAFASGGTNAETAANLFNIFQTASVNSGAASSFNFGAPSVPVSSELFAPGPIVCDEDKIDSRRERLTKKMLLKIESLRKAPK